MLVRELRSHKPRGKAKKKKSGFFSSEYMLSRVQLSVTPWTVATRLLCQQDFPGKNTGRGCHFLLQGIKSATLTLLDGFFSTSPPGKPSVAVFRPMVFFPSVPLVAEVYKMKRVPLYLIWNCVLHVEHRRD